MPLEKAQALDSAGDALNEQVDTGVHEHALAKREQCYEIIINALRSLKGEGSQKEFGSPVRFVAARSILDQASRKKKELFQALENCPYLGVAIQSGACHSHGGVPLVLIFLPDQMTACI